MVTTPAERPVADSKVQMSEIVLPADTNSRGSIFGGRVLSLIDKCAAIAAMRHSQGQAVTAAMDSVVFVNQVRLGYVMSLRGRLNAVFRSSMEVEVEVRSEDPSSGEQTLTTTAFVTMVAVDERGRPRAVPRLRLSNDEERRRAQGAAERRKARLRWRQRDG